MQRSHAGRGSGGGRVWPYSCEVLM